MAILYVLKLQNNESDFLNDGSESSPSEKYTVTPFLLSTETVPSRSSHALRTTFKPQKNTLLPPSSPDAVLPTTKTELHRSSTQDSSRKMPFGLFSLNHTPTLNGRCCRVYTIVTPVLYNNFKHWRKVKGALSRYFGVILSFWNMFLHQWKPKIIV